MALIKQFPLGPLQTNCYFLGCEETKQAAIIDPSWDGNGLTQVAQQLGYTITHILLTHTHFDHVGGLADLKAAVNVPIYAHDDANAMMPYAAQSAMRFGVTMGECPSADQSLQEGDVIAVGNLKLDVLYTPGHAPGHVSFYLKSDDVVFDGDVLFQFSIGRTDLPGGDFATLIQSINEKLLPLPDNTRVLCGHGPETTIGAERRSNPFLQD